MDNGSRRPSNAPAGKRFKTQDSVRPVAASHRRHACQQGARVRSSSYTDRQRRARSASRGCRQVSQQRRSPIPFVVAGLLVIVLLVFAVPRVVSLIANGGVEAGQKVEVTIPDGASGDSIVNRLLKAHVIEDAKSYYAAVKDQGAESKLQPGSYSFTTLMDPALVVKQLVKGPNAASKLVVPEGLTVKQLAARVSKAYGISSADFLAQAKASNYVDRFPFLKSVSDDSLEGFLCPKTYTLTGSKISADTVISAMLEQYQKEYASLDFTRAEAVLKNTYGIDLNDYQILVLASIVEREAVTDTQRYKVASTFYNRLKANMPLQSDAVMGYVTGGAVSADDLKKESPYNTYLNKGLPPTPICSPSLKSLKATLNPADTDYLYFFITNKSEYFSQTYDQHLQAIEENK